MLVITLKLLWLPHVYATPCSKVSPVNIANGGQSWTNIKFSSAGGIPLISLIIRLQHYPTDLIPGLLSSEHIDLFE